MRARDLGAVVAAVACVAACSSPREEAGAVRVEDFRVLFPEPYTGLEALFLGRVRLASGEMAAVTLTVDFGDGHREDANVDGQGHWQAAHRYARAGTFSVQAMAAAPAGSDTARRVLPVFLPVGGVRIQCLACDGVSCPPTPCDRLGSPTVTFQAVSTGGHGALQHEWSFGDGSGLAAGPQVTHTFAQAGAHAVGLVVRDQGHSVGATGLTYAVGGLPAVEAQLETFPVQGEAPLLVEATLVAQGDGPVVLTVNWGDASAQSFPVAQPGPQFPVAAQHTYLARGSYSVHVVVRDVHGQVAETGTEILVGPRVQDGGTLPDAAVQDAGDPGDARTGDFTPPGDVQGLAARGFHQAVTLTWTDPPDADLAEVRVTWSPGGETAVTVVAGTQELVVYPLVNGQDYRFTVETRDRAGNASAGVSVDGTPHGSPPQPGQGPVFEDMDSTGARVVWLAAQDDGTAQPLLDYRVVRAAQRAALDTPEHALAVLGDGVVLDWTAGALQAALGGLAAGSSWWVAVLVRDEDGLVALYPPALLTTLP